MSGGHIPTFHSVTEWETGRNVPCWAECPCGWSPTWQPREQQWRDGIECEPLTGWDE